VVETVRSLKVVPQVGAACGYHAAFNMRTIESCKLGVQKLLSESASSVVEMKHLLDAKTYTQFYTNALQVLRAGGHCCSSSSSASCSASSSAADPTNLHEDTLRSLLPAGSNIIMSWPMARTLLSYGTPLIDVQRIVNLLRSCGNATFVSNTTPQSMHGTHWIAVHLQIKSGNKLQFAIADSLNNFASHKQWANLMASVLQQYFNSPRDEDLRRIRVLTDLMHKLAAFMPDKQHMEHWTPVIRALCVDPERSLFGCKLSRELVNATRAAWRAAGIALRSADEKTVKWEERASYLLAMLPPKLQLDLQRAVLWPLLQRQVQEQLNALTANDSKMDGLAEQVQHALLASRPSGWSVSDAMESLHKVYTLLDANRAKLLRPSHTRKRAREARSSSGLSPRSDSNRTAKRLRH